MHKPDIQRCEAKGLENNIGDKVNRTQNTNVSLN